MGPVPCFLSPLGKDSPTVEDTVAQLDDEKSQRLSSVRATAYRHDAHNDQRAAVTPAAQADARYEAQAAETMTASRRVRQCFAGGSVAAAGTMLYLQPDKIIKKLRREQRSKTHVIGQIGTQLGTPQLCVGETPCPAVRPDSPICYSNPTTRNGHRSSTTYSKK